MCMCMIDSLCCTPETNNIVNQLHSNKLKKKIEGKITVLKNYYHRLSRLKNNTNRKKNLDFFPLIYREETAAPANGRG